MIISDFPPLTSTEAAVAVKDFYDKRRDQFVAMGDLCCEGNFLPKNTALGIFLYHQALEAGAKLSPERKRIVVLRIIDYYLQRSSYSKTVPFFRQLNADDIMMLAEMYRDAGASSAAACCFEAYVRSPDAPDDEQMLDSRIYLIDYYIAQSQFSKAVHFLCDGEDGIIADLPDRLNPANRLVLAEYFYGQDQFEEVETCLSSLCGKNEDGSDFRVEALLLRAYCRNEKFDKAAKVFLSIPIPQLTEEMVYLGIVALRTVENDNRPLLNYCFNVCLQRPKLEKASLYAGLLEEHYLNANDFPAALKWTKLSGDEEQAEILQQNVRKNNLERLMATICSTFALIALLFLPQSLKIPLWQNFDLYSWSGYVSGACLIIWLLVRSGLALRREAKQFGGSAVRNAYIVSSVIAMVGAGILLNSNIFSVGTGKFFCFAESVAAAAVFLMLWYREEFPMTGICQFLSVRKFFAFLFSAILSIAAGILLAAWLKHADLFWCGSIVFILFFSALSRRFAKPATKEQNNGNDN